MTAQDAASINGALLRRQREARGWSLSDVATRACMSIKQIRQIEDGGLSAFYSEAVKQTAARKVGAILGVSPEAVFGSDVVVTPAVTELSFVTAHEAAELLALSEGDVSESVEAAETHAVQAEAVADVAPSDASPAPAESAEASPASPGRTKNSWGLIAVLFVGAIALAASMRPSQEPPAAVEPPPALAPALQGGPAEPAVASSAAATADGGSAVAPVEAAVVAAPVQATPQTAPAPAGPASQAKPN